jgi:hypothetical protein
MPNRVSSWAMLLWTAVMAIGIVAAFVGIGGDCRGLAGDAFAQCQADAWIRGGIGLSLLLFLWFVVMLPMAAVWFVTRPKENVTVYGPDGQQVMLSEAEANRRVATPGWTYQRPERGEIAVS